MHDTQHTCHEHDACERTGHASAQQYTHTRIPVNNSSTKLNHILLKAIRKPEKNRTNSTNVE